jgi:DNA-binding response OmpR family regulator
LVEDNPGDVELFRWALKKAGVDCELTVIRDGAEALAKVRGEDASASPDTPDLVVLDLNLPKADGHEILAAMRATRAFSNVPVAILTSSTSLRERKRLEALRIARYLAKPPNLKEFVRLGSAVKDLLLELPS